MQNNNETTTSTKGNKMTQTKLNCVIEGILDPAVAEYLEINSTITGIKSYAEGGCDVYITENDAVKIQKCLTWVKNYSGKEYQNDYYYNVTVILAN